MPIKREEIIGDCRLILGDNMPLMADMGDNEFQLAIVDPPYRDVNHPDQWLRANSGDMKKWEAAPKEDYFVELKRVSEDQMIWGGNYFTDYLEANNNWVIWHKLNDGVHFSMCEMAWSSIRKNIKLWKYNHAGAKKIHPTQKPVALYRWLLKNYAKPGDHILDTHGGSMSIVIACIEMGFKITCIEIDEDYYEAGVDRVKKHQRQGKLFLPPKQQPKPQGLF